MIATCALRQPWGHPSCPDKTPRGGAGATSLSSIPLPQEVNGWRRDEQSETSWPQPASAHAWTQVHAIRSYAAAVTLCVNAEYHPFLVRAMSCHARAMAKKRVEEHASSHARATRLFCFIFLPLTGAARLNQVSMSAHLGSSSS